MRAQRRYEEKRVQTRRIRLYLIIWSWPKGMSKQQKGILKCGHFGCGCPTCKDWKHPTRKYSPRERAKYCQKELF